METKLTLKLDTDAIDRAKRYVRRHKGASLSKLVENYFNALTRRETAGEKRIPPIVASLAGVAKKTRGRNIRKEYTDYLIEKYR